MSCPQPGDSTYLLPGQKSDAPFWQWQWDKGFYPARAATPTSGHGSFALDANMSTQVHYPAHSEDKDWHISWDNLLALEGSSRLHHLKPPDSASPVSKLVRESCGNISLYEMVGWWWLVIQSMQMLDFSLYIAVLYTIEPLKKKSFFCAFKNKTNKSSYG